MTRWLQRQEAVIWFSGFLNWQHCLGLSNSEGSDSPGLVPSYQISQKPQFLKKTVHYLDQHHGALCFLDALKTFVSTLPRGPQYFEPNIHDHFDLFSNLVLHMPRFEHAAHRDLRIRSHPECSNRVHKPPTPARFDTVLVEVDPEQQQRRGLHGKTNCSVFRLPLHLGQYPQPLAYIHWFKPLQTYNRNVKMFRVSRSTRQWLSNAEIIPIDRIIHGVQFIPTGYVVMHWPIVSTSTSTSTLTFAFLNSIGYILSNHACGEGVGGWVGCK
ncbi:hypothetical protein L210DRAFT_858080 [Boletus edulis BED1]|uniref:Uncharacterized protein n=1 Tax=Boletus edulis BED1 TaxID=1328754 RepID=A0AAD4GF85_BOLED|nr:hypothetical protein L210DRAFT_858080 [Boletus edulis BED1]